MAAFDAGANPSSVHGAGRAARAVVERCRRRIAAVFEVAPDRVTFVSGATEGNALVLAGGLAVGGKRAGDSESQRWTAVLASATEHDSVAAWATVGSDGAIPVTPTGLVDMNGLAERLAPLGAPDRSIVSVMAVNNETGVINPIGEIAAQCGAAGVRLHCDAAQAVGRVRLPDAVRGADIVTLSGHKFGGPPGIGVIVDIAGLVPPALLRGGGQEGGRRPGTENVPAIAGFHAAFDAALAEFEAGEANREATLRDRAVAAIRRIVPEVAVAGEGALRAGNTACLSMPGVSAETQVMALDLEGVAVSAGSACSSGKIRTSPVLTAMGLAPEAAGQFIRVSLGWSTTDDDIERLVNAWGRIHDRLRPAKPAGVGESGRDRGAA